VKSGCDLQGYAFISAISRQNSGQRARWGGAGAFRQPRVSTLGEGIRRHERNQCARMLSLWVGRRYYLSCVDFHSTTFLTFQQIETMSTSSEEVPTTCVQRGAGVQIVQKRIARTWHRQVINSLFMGHHLLGRSGPVRPAFGTEMEPLVACPGIRQIRTMWTGFIGMYALFFFSQRDLADSGTICS
jgi:hypothetical protein